jgi:hypothetical protein
MSVTEPGTPPRKSLSSRTRKPNYILLAVGLILVAAEVSTAILHPLSGPSHALLIALAVTVTLYGLFPVDLIKGEFKGVIGNLVVAGPAAMGLFVFLVMLPLVDKASVPCSNGYVVLFASNNTELSTRIIGKTKVRLLDVDSFSESEITLTLTKLMETVSRSGIVTSDKGRAEQRRIALQMLDAIQLTPRFYNRARALLSSYFGGHTDVDEDWKQQTGDMKKAGNSPEVKQSLDRLKKQPFAFFIVGRETTLQVVTDSSSLRVEGSRLDVPVIANPARKVNPRLEEAVIIKLPEPSTLTQNGG